MLDTTNENLEDFDMSWLDSNEDQEYNAKQHDYEQELKKHFGYDSFTMSKN